MPQIAKEGQKVQMPDGSIAVVQGGKLVPVAVPGGVPQRKLSPQEQKELSNLSANAESARKSAELASKAVSASRGLNTGPVRGTMLDMLIPHGNFLSNITGTLIGGPMQAMGVISPKNVNDYQALKRAQNEGVLQAQIEQKGPQTESDAARMALTGVSTGNTPEQNQQAAEKTAYYAKRAQMRRDFKTQWANKYGVFGQNEQGQTADQVFDSMWDQQQAATANKPKVTVRRVR